MSVTTAPTIPTTPVCYIDQLGIHAPLYQDCLNYYQAQYRAIYGQDVYLENDSQDGQWLGILALSLHDANSMAVAVYNSFSPATAMGNGLSSVVKINGIKRSIPTNSSVDMLIGGQNGTPIVNGIVRDDNQNNWLLPALVTIPSSGQIIVTAQAANPGAIAAGAGTITTILTPTRGWQTALNPGDATAGDPLESDAALRGRQKVSTALPSLTVLDGIIGLVSSLPGVTRLIAYDNDTNTTDENGIPPNSVSFVVEGGDATQIAQAIRLKKTPGTPTYGTTSETVLDQFGVPNTINFFRPTDVLISVAITIQPLAGFTTTTEALISQALADYITALPIGGDVFITKLYSPANLFDTPALSNTFNITSLTISRTGPPVAADVPMAFNEAAVCSVNNVALTALVH